MHAKVTIASLVFGLAVGFAANIGVSQKITKAKEENMVCNHDNHEHIEFSPKAEKDVNRGIVITPGPGGGSHTHSYSYAYLNDGRHTGVCSCGSSLTEEHTFSAYYPYGHGHNDMLYCSKCDTTVELTRLYENQSSTGSVASGAAKWYLFIPEYTGTYIFETTGSSDTYGELYLGNYPTTRTTSNDDISTTNRNFRITWNLTGGQNVFLRVRGWNWNAASFSLSVRQNHTHNYSRLEQYDSNSHKCICSCGEYQLQPHSYNYQAFTDAFHKKVCACGRTVTEEHVFNNYLPYGHGHNDLIQCANCGTNVECQRLTENNPINDYIDIDDADWYIFIPQEPGTYIFETTGTTDTCGSLYIGDYPTGTPIEDDDNGENNNFRIRQYLNAGETAFLRINGYDWYYYGSYSISVVKEIPVNPIREWTIMVYACGSSLTTFESSNISDMINVPNQPSDVNVIIETGGSPSSWGVQEASGAYIPYNKITRYHLRNNNLYREYDFGDLTDANMGDQATFESFLNWGFSRYPAEHIGVILINHGGGLVGVCRDDRHDGDMLTNSETSAAFANAFAQNGIEYNLDFIGYDACMMQLQDVAEFNSHYFNYMLASQIPTSELGWNYAPLLENIYNHNVIENNPSAYPDGVALTALKQTAKAFINNGYAWEQTLSVLDLTQMASYLNAFELLADSIIYRVAHGALSTFTIQNGILQTFDVYGEHSYGNGDCIEMLNILEANTDSGLLPRINAVRAFFPNNGNYDPYYFNTTIDGTDGYTIVEGNGLVRYYAASKGRGGNPPITHGLAVCVGAAPYEIEEIYPESETHFTRWRDVVFATEDPHFHNFSQCVPYNNTYHKRVCECGSYYLQNHTFNYTQMINGREYGHCSGCNAMIDISSTPTPGY